jgi:5-methyltetrahydrofolate--homocysteine methyltransferase
MIPILQRLKSEEVLIADGAMGTMLLSMGLDPGDSPEKLNLESPELFEEIARQYLMAGAQIVQTNTFGGSALKLGFYGLSDRTTEINRAAVLAVRNAVGDSAYVSGSCGPSGKMLEPYGDVSRSTMRRSYEIQIAALVEAGVDMICVETMTDPLEAEIAINTAKAIDPDIPVAATMTFDETPGGFRTIMGTSIEEAARALRAAGADILGSNCGNGIEKMVSIARHFKACTDLPLIIQSNAGLPELIDGAPTYRETPEFMAGFVSDLIDTGVSIIGGCCGTTPEHIAAFSEAVKSKCA